VQKEYANRIGLTAVGPLLVLLLGVFFFFIFKKYKISKINGRFKKFQKRTPVAQATGDRDLSVIFFQTYFSKFANKSLAGDVTLFSFLYF